MSLPEYETADPMDQEPPRLEEAPDADFATFCPDCEAMFFEGDEGWDCEVCFECGGPNCYEVPA